MHNYCSIRQNGVRKTLQSLRLNNVMKEKQFSVSEALNFVREKISSLTPQGPIAHRTEESKVEYLYQALIGCEWAKAALSNV